MGTTCQAQLSAKAAGQKERFAFDIDDRPHMKSFRLPGVRRKLEGRGGAQARLEVMRYVIRCPLLPSLAHAIARRDLSRGGRAAVIPDVFWLFYAAISREFASAEAAREEILANWVAVAKEFHFEHGVCLPTLPKFDHSGFTSWRKRNIERPWQLETLLQRFTETSALLALAVRDAYAPGHEPDRLNPTRWDMLSGDGTMFNAPSNVREVTGPDGKTVLLGSRAKNPTKARVHSPQRNSTKGYGAKEGLDYCAVSTQGYDSYTCTILGLDIGRVEEGEMTVAMRVMHSVLDALGPEFPVLTYDALLFPIYYQDLMRRGVLTINTNRSRTKKTTHRPGEATFEEHDRSDNLTGQGIRRHGTRSGAAKATYVTPLNPATCIHGGTEHRHHLAADDGTIYEIETHLRSGRGSKRKQALTTVRLDLQGDPGNHWFKLTVEGVCDRAPHATFTTNVDLHWTQPQTSKRKDGSEPRYLDARSTIANIRPIPDTDERHDHARGNRNHSESKFSWLEHRYHLKDRAQSYERPGQLLDYLAAGLLNNAETWAHLVVRHPEAAAPLAQALDEFPTLEVADLVEPTPYQAPGEAARDEEPELLTLDPAAKTLSLSPAAIARPNQLLTVDGLNAPTKETKPCLPPPAPVSAWT